MKHDISFFPAKLTDFETVWALFCDAIAAMEAQGIRQWDEKYPTPEIIRNDIEKGELYFLTQNKTIAAAVVLNTTQDDEYKLGNWSDAAGTAGVVHRLCVSPCFQNKGIGKLAMAFSEERLRHRECSSVRLDAFSLNPYALRLYETLGYVKTGEVQFRKGLLYLFEKQLSRL